MGYDANGGGTMIIKHENFDKVVEAYHKWTAETGYDSSDKRDVRAVFNDQWFEISFDENGDTKWIDFPFTRYDDQPDFIAMLAPWVENGSYIDFTGEDGEMWRISIFNHKFYDTPGVVTYPGDPYSGKGL